MKSNEVNNNIKFYIFLEVLKKYSNINPHEEISKEVKKTKLNHMILSVKEINEKMKTEIYERMNIELQQDLDRRTIYQYVDDLKELGFEITTYKDNKIGYALVTKDIERYELRILVDSLSANRFMTKKKTAELIGKLCKFQNEYAGYDFYKQVSIPDRAKSINEGILNNINSIDAAISRGKKITFNYCDYNYKKELVYRTYKDSQDKKQYTVTPIGLILKEDHYYLVTIHNKYNDLTNYRVDRMKDVIVLDEDGRSLKEIKGYEDGKFNAAIYAKKNFKMFSGDDCEVVLRINKNLLNLVIDELGDDVKLHKIDDDTFQASFNAQYGTGLTKWVLQLGADANVISPPELREDVRKSLEDMMEKQKIDTSTSDLNQDVIAMARAHDEACVQVFFVRNGKIVGREHFILEGVMDSTRESILGSFVKQFYMEQEYVPKEIIIEDEIEDSFILSEWLSSKKGQKVTIRVPQKGEKKSLIEMVRKNAIEYLEKFSDMNKRKYEKSIGALEELKQILNLDNIPKRIESFDISNIQGVDSIGSMVVFTNGKKDKKEYRRYKIKTVIGPNDYDSMAEIVERRLKYGDFPDLMLLDGGKGQVSAVKKVLNKYNVEIPLWGMYKDDKHRTKGLISQEKEIELDRTSNLYRFVASIQEEVHNYAISYHRSLRNKSLTKSELDDIQGIGEKRKKALLNHFKDIEAIKKATFEELLEVEGMNKTSSESVYNYFRKGC